MLTLYYTPTACSTASHVALEEAGADYHAERIKLYRPEEQEKYRSINPKGTVPALSIDGRILTENTAILTYVGTTYPEARLLPDDPEAFAQCVSFMAWLASSVQLARRQARAPQRFTSDESVFEVLKKSASPVFEGYLGKIDQMLDGRDWVMGDQYTVADCYALVIYHWGVIDEFDMDSYKNFTSFKNRMIARPAVRAVLTKERSVLVPGEGG